MLLRKPPGLVDFHVREREPSFGTVKINMKRPPALFRDGKDVLPRLILTDAFDVLRIGKASDLGEAMCIEVKPPCAFMFGNEKALSIGCRLQIVTAYAGNPPMVFQLQVSARGQFVLP